MSLKPEIPVLLKWMQEAIEKAKEKNPNLNIERQETTLYFFESLHKDYVYLHEEFKILTEANKKLYADNSNLSIANKRIIEVCENLKNQLKAKDF